MDVALEFYAGHPVPGRALEPDGPLGGEDAEAFSFQAQDILICTKNQLVADFLFDLRVLLQLAEMLDENSFRRAGVPIPWRRCTGRCTSPHRPWTVRPGWRACARRAVTAPRCLPQRRQRTRAALLGHSHGHRLALANC
ncbi:MAG: hypothetical protein ACLRI7_05905 [Ruthenibacterium lactatiformans]